MVYYHLFDMRKVEIHGDGDILGRVNSRSYFRYVAGKQVSKQLPLPGFRRRQHYTRAHRWSPIQVLTRIDVATCASSIS